MAMTGGNVGGLSSTPNVTPLIDVLLVLLIIFMVITPTTPHGLDALVPQPPKNPQHQNDSDRTIVVQVLSLQAESPRTRSMRPTLRTASCCLNWRRSMPLAPRK